MPNVIVLPKNYAVTYEDCPICQEPNMRIKHGYAEGHPEHFLHLEYCKDEECDNHDEPIVIVGYDCHTCLEQLSRNEVE